MKISAFNLLLELRGVYSVVLLFDKLGTTKQLDTSGSIAVDAIPSSVSHSCWFISAFWSICCSGDSLSKQMWQFLCFHWTTYCKQYSNYKKISVHWKEIKTVVFLSNQTFPPSVSHSTHAGPLFCTKGYFNDYFSMCIAFLYILLIRTSLTYITVGLCSDYNDYQQCFIRLCILQNCISLAY